MKILEIVTESKTQTVAVAKPRNFVAKNAMKTTSGAGEHTNRKKLVKQGNVKHKGKEYAESVAEGSIDTGGGVRQWANQVRKDHGADVKFRNRQEGGGAVDSIIAKNSQGDTVGVFNRKTNYPTVYEPKKGVTESADDFASMNPIDFSSKPSFKDIVARYNQLFYQGNEGDHSDQESAESDAIEQYVAKRFGDKGIAQLQKAAKTSFYGRNDGRGMGGYRGDNLGRASQPVGNFRTTKVGKMYAQDAGIMKNKVADRLGRHPKPNLPESDMAEAYSVTRGIDRERYQERPGLEGPFSTRSGKVVYYDAKEGKYYDPDTDMYIEYDDWQAMNEQGVAEVDTQYSRANNTVGFSVNSEDAYNAVMARFGDYIDHDETSGIMYVPARMWPNVEQVAYDADGEGATEDNGYDDQTGVKEGSFGSGYGSVFTLYVNTGEKPPTKTKTKKFKREDDAVAWAEDYSDRYDQYPNLKMEIKDENGGVVWELAESQGVAKSTMSASIGETATAGGMSSANFSVGAGHPNKSGKTYKNKDGTVKNALDVKGANLMTGGGRIKR